MIITFHVNAIGCHLIIDCVEGIVEYPHLARFPLIIHEGLCFNYSAGPNYERRLSLGFLYNTAFTTSFLVMNFS